MTWKSAKLREEDGRTGIFSQNGHKSQAGHHHEKHNIEKGTECCLCRAPVGRVQRQNDPRSSSHPCTAGGRGGYAYQYRADPIRPYRSPGGRTRLTRFGEEYYALAPNAKFTTLKKVPTVWKADPYTDCTAYPKREGFVDILGVFAKAGGKPHWTAAVVPSRGYLWFFSGKIRMYLPATVFWMSKQGAPCRTLERTEPGASAWRDVCAYLAVGFGRQREEKPP